MVWCLIMDLMVRVLAGVVITNPQAALQTLNGGLLLDPPHPLYSLSLSLSPCDCFSDLSLSSSHRTVHVISLSRCVCVCIHSTFQWCLWQSMCLLVVTAFTAISSPSDIYGPEVLCSVFVLFVSQYSTLHNISVQVWVRQLNASLKTIETYIFSDFTRILPCLFCFVFICWGLEIYISETSATNPVQWCQLEQGMVLENCIWKSQK